MKFGIHIAQQHLSMNDLRKIWRWADTSGLDWVSVWDHFYESTPADSLGAVRAGLNRSARESHQAPYVSLPPTRSGSFESTACMAAMACDTANVRIGVLVLGMSYRHPAVLANTLCTIDQLSAGRLEVGLGAGWHETEYQAYGIPFRPIGQRMDALEEGIQVVKMLLTQDRSNFTGRYFTLVDAACYPKPVQDRPRIWVGGNGEKRTLRIVARHADGWNAMPYTSVGDFIRLSGVLENWCELEGRDPRTIERNVNLAFHMGANAALLPRAERQLGQIWGPAADHMRKQGAVVGLPEQAVDLVRSYEQAGAARLNVILRAPIDWDALHSWTEQVIPRFR